MITITFRSVKGYTTSSEIVQILWKTDKNYKKKTWKLNSSEKLTINYIKKHIVHAQVDANGIDIINFVKHILISIIYINVEYQSI